LRQKLSHLSLVFSSCLVSFCYLLSRNDRSLAILVRYFHRSFFFILIIVPFLYTVVLGLDQCTFIVGLLGKNLRVHAQSNEYISCFLLSTEFQNFLSIYFITRSVIKTRYSLNSRQQVETTSLYS
jgi:hypothetical protein